MPSVKPRTNLATVTMPVRLASAKEIERVNDGAVGDISPYNITANTTIEVPQFSILLTRKGANTPKLRSGAKLPVFAQLNKIKASHGNNFKSRRQSLLRDLKFAGIAFTHAKREEDVGDSHLMAAVIGGSHTVMSYRSDHSDDPIRPGTSVRWTLPGEGVENMPGGPPPSLTDVPVKYTGTGDDILAELEPVDPTRMIDDVVDGIAHEAGVQRYIATPGDAVAKQNAYDIAFQNSLVASGNAATRTIIENTIKAYDNLRSREIGTVICDNGRGSIDIRLK